jgi:hypothetical protein
MFPNYFYYISLRELTQMQCCGSGILSFCATWIWYEFFPDPGNHNEIGLLFRLIPENVRSKKKFL